MRRRDEARVGWGRCRSGRLLALLIAALGVPGMASAEDELPGLLARLPDASTELGAEAARARLAEADAEAARAQLLPALRASAGYQRNELEVAIELPTADGSRSVTFTPFDQLDAQASLEVPLVDAPAWIRLASAEAAGDAAEARVLATRRRLELRVVEAYHQVLAARGLLSGARASASAAEALRARAEARVEAGLADELEVARAEVEVARAHQRVVEQEASTRRAERAMRVLVGAVPSSSASLPGGCREAEPRLDPVVDSARQEARAAHLAQEAAVWRWLPTLAGYARQRVTNASGFAPAAVWSAGLQLTWSLDFGILADVHRSEAREDVAEAQLETAVRDTETGLLEARLQVEEREATAVAADELVASSRRALTLAEGRFASQLATQVDVVTAQRDAAEADAQAVLAHAELSLARCTLAVRLGANLEEGPR